MRHCRQRGPERVWKFHDLDIDVARDRGLSIMKRQQTVNATSAAQQRQQGRLCPDYDLSGHGFQVRWLPEEKQLTNRDLCRDASSR